MTLMRYVFFPPCFLFFFVPICWCGYALKRDWGGLRRFELSEASIIYRGANGQNIEIVSSMVEELFVVYS